MAGAILERRSRVDVTSLLDQVKAPTPVLHARDDAVVPLSEGRLIAAGRRGSRLLVPVATREDDPRPDHRGAEQRDDLRAPSLSEKTVRNHVSNVFDKLGVRSRAQAIVFARDRHFGGDDAGSA